MTQKASLALGAIWEETSAFVRAEWALLSPVAMLGFGLPMVIMLLAVPTDAATTGKVAAGAWMFWFLPSGLLSMIGSLAISALALRPGMSVRECIGLAFRRLPAGIGLFLLNLAAQIVLALPLTLIGLIETRLAGAVGVGSVLANFAVLAVTVWLFVRVLPIWALLADRPMSPLALVREAFRLTRLHYPRLLLLRLVGACAGMLVLVVMLIPIGGVFALIGKLTGAQDAVQTLSFVAVAALFAMLAGTWTVYVARLARRLGEVAA